MKISAIIPVYNSELYIRQCLDSILSQTLTDFEVIVIDDGSTDSSISICEEYQNKDLRIKFYKSNHRGVSYARNLGIEVSSGEWITFIDSDDWIDSDMFKTLYNYAIHNNVDVILSNFIFEKNNESIYTQSAPSIITKKQFPSFPLALMVENCSKADGIDIKVEVLSAACAKLTRRELIVKNRILFTERLKLNEDGLFHLKCYLYASSFIIINKAFYHYRLHSSSSNYRFRPDVHSQMSIWMEEFSKISCHFHEIGKKEFDSLSAYRRFLNLLNLYIIHPSNTMSIYEKYRITNCYLNTGVYNVLSVPNCIPLYKQIEIYLLKCKLAAILIITGYTKRIFKRLIC